MFRLEENEKLVLTPFEKNLDIWRQLWRVLERSDLASPWQSVLTLSLDVFVYLILDSFFFQIVMVVDARDPLF